MPEDKDKTEKKPHPGGRPLKYDPAFCAQILELGKQGVSMAGFASHLNISRETLYDWRNSYPEFSDTLKRAIAYSQAFYEDIGRKHMIENPGGSKVNPSLYIFTMKNRFREDYGDQPQVVINKTEDTKLPDEVKNKLDALEAKIRDSGKR